MKKYTYIIYGVFECEVEADSADEARAKFDINDADISVQGCYEVEDEDSN